MKQHINMNNRGFTIIELMIATLVFSIVLLVMTMGIMSVGRSFYKGVISSKTQEAARLVVDDIGRAIQFSTSNVIEIGTSGYCIGDKLYSYQLNAQTGGTQKSFVVSTVAGGCTASTSALTPAQRDLPGTRALLGEKMRLSEFRVRSAGSGAYEIIVKVAYGDPPDLLNANSPASQCSNEVRASQYCATAKVTSYVQRRLQTN